MASTSNGQWFPPEWPARIRALARGELTPVRPRVAATVMLLRDGAEGPEVFLLRRRTSMAFAAGAYAYPGGGVDPRDERTVPWAGPVRGEWARVLGVQETLAQAVVCAAVRETFEETGVLLAAPGDGVPVAGATAAEEDEADRAALAARELSFTELLERRGLSLRSDLLRPWARWITPEFEPRRYDTWFFAARLPEGMRTRNASTEADRAAWVRPADAAAAYDRGEMLMMPPTITTLRSLAGHASAEEALRAAEGRDLAPVLARAHVDGGGDVVLTWPGHAEFTRRVGSEGAPS